MKAAVGQQQRVLKDSEKKIGKNKHFKTSPGITFRKSQSCGPVFVLWFLFD